MQANDQVSYNTMLDRIKRHRSIMTRQAKHRYTKPVALHGCTAYGLGSAVNGATISVLPCANASSRGHLRQCPHPGLLACSKCSLVNYCSPRCQMQHWPTHRPDCQCVFLGGDWKRFCPVDQCDSTGDTPTVITQAASAHIFWSASPAFDCLRVSHNEGSNARDHNFRICLADSPDILNVIQTVNNLPMDYRGRCDILLNNVDAITANRNLLVLYALLHPGPSIDESAEFVTHLMYSAMLPATGAAYLRRCVRSTYGQGPTVNQLSFQTCTDTRGKGKLYSMQLAMAVKRPIEMFFSKYEAGKAIISFRTALWKPQRALERGVFLENLSPGHRLAFVRFWKTGVLAPFPLTLSFSPQGEWLGQPMFNPLRGFDVARVLESGANHKVEPADIMGCLFFHIKDELKEFATRVALLNVNIHLTQFDPKVLCRGLAISAIPAFERGRFDRIDLSDLIDTVGLKELLDGWAPLMNKQNHCSCITMRSEKWYSTRPKATARTNPRIFDLLRRKCQSLSLKRLVRYIRSPMLSRLVHSLDAFLDHESAFQEYLHHQELESALKGSSLQLRSMHKIHSKAPSFPQRHGVPIEFPDRKLPVVSKEEFYNIFTLGAADFPIRFVEFEVDKLEN
ncbi:hypothetical protein JOM56_007219 [Amanita muscaria]